MLKTFIIDGVKTEILLTKSSSKAELLEVTSFSDKQRNYIHSGFHFLRLEGISSDGREINNAFRVISTKEDVLELKSFANYNDLYFREK